MAELGPVTCAGCGLLCDDVTVERVGDGVRLQPAVCLGAEWFAERVCARRTARRRRPIDGEPADVESALARAAELLRGARRPLLHGFDGATVEDARAAVALADRLGALVSTGELAGAWPGAPAVPLRGASTATLGEIRDRSQVVVIWREDPETTHPRLLERLGFARRRRGADRTLVVVDDRDTATAAARRCATALAARARPRGADEPARVAARARAAGGRARDELEGLIERMRRRATCRVRVRTRPDRRRRAASDARSRSTSSSGRCATSATRSRSSCRAPPGPGARTTCWPGRPGTAGRWTSPAVIPELVTATAAARGRRRHAAASRPGAGSRG